MSESVVTMDVVRRLALVGVRISVGIDLASSFQAVADGVVDVVGFGMAVVNHRLPSGDFAVVAIAGPDDLRNALMGAVSPRKDMARALELGDEWGNLRFIPQERFEETAAAQWVPGGSVLDDPDAWQPRDMLLAPMWSDDGDMIGVLSVDQPPGRKRPSAQVRELLDIFVSQAGIALAAVELRQLYRAERTLREELLTDLAHRDSLTGLANRRVLDARLLRSIGTAARTGRAGALLFCDVDRLKTLNDQHGHPHGDAILMACAAAITEHVRKGDLVSRIGGDEFVIVADAITTSAAADLAQRLRGAVMPARDGNDAGVTMSVGVALIDGSSSPDALIAEADAAMYQGKTKRR